MPAYYCHLCGREIKQRSKTVRHPLWPREQCLRVCTDCYRTKPRCRVCNMPMAVLSAYGVCPTCEASMSFCLSCGRPIPGGYMEIDGVGPYCQNCYHHRPPCDVCGAPLTDERWKLSDGRITCAHCHTTAIYSPVQASSLYKEMRDVIARTLGLRLNVPTGLALVDRVQLAEIIRQQVNGLEALDPDRTLGLYARRGMKRGIYVQTGLPRTLLQQIAAHEFAHAWQGENCPLLREPVLHEGFAEWVAYQLLVYYGYNRQQQRMLARQDVYGQGLRWALDTQARQGISGLLEACREAR